MGRKRQRSRATDDDEQPVATIDESVSTQDHRSNSLVNGDGDEEPSEERAREVEVWDAFKEEHHEVLEQLPLSLHRQFKLMRELDSQSEGLHKDILASVRKYIRLRESLVVQSVQAQSNTMDVDIDQGGNTSAGPIQAETVNSSHTNEVVNVNVEVANTNARSPSPYQLKSAETTRTFLQHIAQTSEEAIRTAEEKVSIAQTAYETVDRQIRLLDQAIKEQEAAISLGVRPGTHLAPILLPDLIVPRWARPSRVEHSPVPSLSPEPELHAEEPPIKLPPPQQPLSKAPKKGKKVAPKPTKPEKEEMHASTVADGEGPMAPRTRRTSVRLTLPAQPQPPGPSVPADPSETRYCYCNQVSFGTMIACDYEGGCRLEWFHFGCTGLAEVPGKKTKWYCRECQPKMSQRGRSRM